MKSLMAVVAASGLLLGAMEALAAEAPPLQQPPIELNAADVVPGGKLKGVAHKIEPAVQNDGFVNTYTLQTEWGGMEATGNFHLMARIQEAAALQELDRMSRAGAFGDALKDGALAPIEGGKKLVTAPVETTKGAVKGVGRWMSNVGRGVTSDDPHQEGAVSAALGYDGTKRAYALEFGVDPWTDWEPLQQALGSVAKASVAGSITASVAMDLATEDSLNLAITVLSLTNDMNEMLRDNPAGEITKINRKKLEGIGVDSAVADGFLRNYNYTPMEASLLVEALIRMGNVQGRDAYLALATGAPDKPVARWMQQRAEMMANYNTKVKPADIVEIADEAWQKTPDGTVVGVFPIDYLPWTSSAATAIAATNAEIEKMGDIKSKEVWLEGSATDDARRALEVSGWVVKEDAGLLAGK